MSTQREIPVTKTGTPLTPEVVDSVDGGVEKPPDGKAAEERGESIEKPAGRFRTIEVVVAGAAFSVGTARL